MKNPIMTKTVALASLFGGLMMTQTAQALPLIDIDLKAAFWQSQYAGEINQDEQTASFEDLGLDDESNNSLSLTVRHAVPLIPNVKLQKTTLDTTSSGTISQTFTFEDVDFSSNEEVTTNLDLSHLDLTAFYSFLYFDVGLTGRNFDTQSTITGNAGTGTVTLDGWIPMLYLGVNADLPFTGVYIDASLNAITYDGNGLQDLSAAVGYNLGDIFPLTAELGYRSMNFALDDLDGLAGDFTIDGWFLSLGLAL